MKVIVKRVTPHGQPNEVVVRDEQLFCERCKATGVDLQSAFEPTTLGRNLWFVVCHDEQACRGRVLDLQATRVRPPARISDLYPE